KYVTSIQREASHFAIPVPPAPEKPPSSPPQAQALAIDIPALVRAHENASAAWSKADAERMALVRQLVEATREREKLARLGKDLDEVPMPLPSASLSKLQEASRD